jgi:hypothetical protein
LLKLLTSYIQKNHVLLPHSCPYYCLIQNHIIEDQQLKNIQTKSEEDTLIE